MKSCRWKLHQDRFSVPLESAVILKNNHIVANLKKSLGTILLPANTVLWLLTFPKRTALEMIKKGAQESFRMKIP